MSVSVLSVAKLNFQYQDGDFLVSKSDQAFHLYVTLFI